MEREMNEKTIKANEEKIKKQVLTNKEFYKRQLEKIGNGYEIGIDTDDGLLESVEDAIIEDIPEITDYFDWLWSDGYYKDDTQESAFENGDNGWCKGNYYSNRYPNGL